MFAIKQAWPKIQGRSYVYYYRQEPLPDWSGTDRPCILAACIFVCQMYSQLFRPGKSTGIHRDQMGGPGSTHGTCMFLMSAAHPFVYQSSACALSLSFLIPLSFFSAISQAQFSMSCVYAILFSVVRCTRTYNVMSMCSILF